MTPALCRAARAFLGWSQDTLAELSGVSAATIRSFERERRDTTRANKKALEGAFAARGVKFLPNGFVHEPVTPVRKR